MILLTLIARVSDGLPLAAAMQEDEQTGRSILEYQNQAKMLFRKLGPQSPATCTIETGPYYFHYLIDNDVCHLVLCEKNFGKRAAFSYLEDIAQEFHIQYGKKVNSVTRPYTFIEFDTYLKKAKNTFSDGRARRNMNVLNNQLQDVQRIMVQNIDDVLQRGTVLSELDTKAHGLLTMSTKYRKDAAYLNYKSVYIKAVAGLVAFSVFVLYFFIL
ncbi:vesicle-trafficking protein SEC22b-B isoform X1 [Copidosoma floridanum]|uniref:vesicle-trafficking protein SEC22b-B isoform X1 n=1 Tax=Copidosoma floridanum TaxID=29053 RepID=UPI0006C9C955|nr:vesicle-trafficking protein SEC22b-B isoform X1 [Copidosoma floridanum]